MENVEPCGINNCIIVSDCVVLSIKTPTRHSPLKSLPSLDIIPEPTGPETETAPDTSETVVVRDCLNADSTPSLLGLDSARWVPERLLQCMPAHTGALSDVRSVSPSVRLFRSVSSTPVHFRAVVTTEH